MTEFQRLRQVIEAKIRGIQMTDEIFEKMKKGVYYPGNHLGKKQELKDLVEKGHLHRMDGSFLCGPDSEPNYRLTDKGLLHKRQKKS
jgi:hypothetical protein